VSATGRWRVRSDQFSGIPGSFRASSDHLEPTFFVRNGDGGLRSLHENIGTTSGREEK